MEFLDEKIKDYSFFKPFFNEGKICIFPTETVYGIGAHFLHKKAVEKIYAIKKRDKLKALTLHISSLEPVKDYLLFSEDFFRLADHFLPGPLTMILRKKDPESLKHISPYKTLALRMPSHPIAKNLIDAGGGVIAATSANLSNEPAYNSVQEMNLELFKDVDLAVDAGESFLKVASTVLDLTVEPYKIYRKGKITKKDIEEVLLKKISIF